MGRFFHIFEGRVLRRLVADHDVLAGQRQLDADPDVLPVLSMAMRGFDQDTAPNDVGVEGLQPGRAGTDRLLQCLKRLHVAERDLSRPDHDTLLLSRNLIPPTVFLWAPTAP